MSAERASAKTPTWTGATLGHPRVHLRRTGSTNDRARALASAGAPHGTLVTAAEQTAGRGRQGRTWLAPPGSALLASLVLRDPPPLLSLIAAVAVCDAVEDRLYGKPARVKWPNDVVLVRGDTRGDPSDRDPPDTIPVGQPVLAKLAGILVEGRPQEGWAVLGIGINVALRVEELPPDLQTTAASLGQPASEIKPLLAKLLEALERRLSEPARAVLDAWRARDALHGREIEWLAGRTGHSMKRSDDEPSPHIKESAHTPGKATPDPHSAVRMAGRAEGVNGDGHLLVRLADGTQTALGSGEIRVRPTSP